MRKFFLLTALSALSALASAQGDTRKVGDADPGAAPGAMARAVTPVFSQLVAFSYPRGFMPAFENSQGGRYIQESVLQGESVNKWSQMITVTGLKGLAVKPDLTPVQFANGIANGYRRACPDSFGGKGLAEFKLGAHPAFASVLGCGKVNAAEGAHSESMLLIVIQGQQDYYTLQWAERGGASITPLPFDAVKWSARLKQLVPIALCPIVPGEAAPYPSCAVSRS